jgi:hypothetical protein
MPVIVYKTLTLNIQYAQGRRILCEHCRQPFTYVWGAEQEFKATGVPLISSDEGMRKSAMKQAANALSNIAKTPNKGESMCPNCKRYQGWMVRKSWFSMLGCGLAAGLILAGIVAVAAGIWFNWGATAITGVLILGTVVGLGLGGAVATRTGPHPDKTDESAMKDAEVPPFLQTCQEKGADPVLVWYLALGNKPAEKQAFISLGVYDTTGQRPIFPRELGTTHVLQALKQ